MAQQTTASLEGMRVLVTGGCGFIGTNLTFALVERGATVAVLDLPGTDWARLPPQVTRVEADIDDPASLRGVFDGVEIVYHLAARTDLDGSTLEDYATNYEGTRNVLVEIARSGSVRRFVDYSTILVNGIVSDTRFVSEDEPYRTNTLYGESKVLAERVTAEECGRAGIEFTTIRPASVYGPWGEEPYDAFFRSIKKRRYVNVGKADNLVSWVYVGNLVDLTLLASVSEAAVGRAYWGSDLHPYPMRQIVDAVSSYYGVRIPTVPAPLLVLAAYVFGIGKVLGLPAPLYPARLKNIRATYCYSMVQAVDLGHVQRHDLAGGITRTLDWYEERGLLD